MISRKRPPQLSLHDELQQVYDDCCSITIKNLTLEEESRVEDALKGWKSLHTSLLFKIDSFEKSNRKMDEEEQNILNEIKSIRDQNVKHLIRVQLRLDEVNRKNSTNKLQPISKQNSSQNSSQSNSLPIPSLRSSNPIKSRSFTNSNNGNQRSLLKSLRPTPSNISSYKTTKNNKGSKSGEASSAAISSWLRPPPPKPEQNVNNIEEADNLFQDFDQDSFEFNDTNWEHIRDYTESPPNLIDMDDNAVSGNKLSQSMDDLTIKPVPNASSTKAASSKPRPPVQNWKSIPDLKQDKPRPYVYAKPKPINIDQLMKPKGASRSAIPQPKMQSSPPKAASSKPRQASAPQAKKSNITYQYIKAPNSVAQKKQGSNKKPVRTKAPLEKEELNSPTMDDLLGAYNTQDQNVAEFSDPSAELLDEMKQDELIASVRGLDPIAAKQILNDIVVHGDEVFWDDIVGLEGAKNSLKEAVVYPFLRPDLFKGLREPTRGMLLFGPPGTGKTMLARAVATESKSTFFSITASSLTSKYLGESEKLVRALFILAKKLSPSIVFIDEIDSLLSSRSDNDNESSRRIKNEFLIQWSELSSAAAARDKESDDRVLILGATNLPWSIDEAARRRFVRRQYIPLPEDETRKHQIIKLLKYQKNTLSEDDHEELIRLTEGFSGSDITALAKDGAMGPLRSLGDKLLSTPTEQIRPIDLNDFRTSLKYIRPSVSHEGLEEYEKWAIKFGSSGA